MTRFAIGQTVKAISNEQGLTQRELYEIVDVEVREAIIGQFETYLVKNAAGEQFVIGNAQFVLEAN